jgi:hypothetical protein
MRWFTNYRDIVAKPRPETRAVPVPLTMRRHSRASFRLPSSLVAISRQPSQPHPAPSRSPENTLPEIRGCCCAIQSNDIAMMFWSRVRRLAAEDVEWSREKCVKLNFWEESELLILIEAYFCS